MCDTRDGLVERLEHVDRWQRLPRIGALDDAEFGSEVFEAHPGSTLPRLDRFGYRVRTGQLRDLARIIGQDRLIIMAVVTVTVTTDIVVCHVDNRGRLDTERVGDGGEPVDGHRDMTEHLLAHVIGNVEIVLRVDACPEHDGPDGVTHGLRYAAGYGVRSEEHTSELQ